MAKEKKVPITRGNDKLVQVTAFIPKDCVVACIVGQRANGEKVDCHVHAVQHVFAPETQF